MCDQYGEGIYADLLFYYGIDLVEVVNLRILSPALVLALIMRLPDDSLTAAMASPAGRAAFGWGMDRHLSAALYDALNANTKATGNWAKGKTPSFPTWPRPGDEVSKQHKKKVTVADLYTKFSRR